MILSLRLIETFVEAARLGSFSAAGRALGLSAGSVSQNVKNLEDALGVRLFERTTRQVRLTREGERYRSRCAPALEALAEAAELARAERESLAGTLRITSTTAFGRDEVLPVIAAFQRAHPELLVELRLSDNFVDLVADGFDLAVRAGVLPENEYISRLLVPVTPLLVASSAYLAQAGTLTSLDDLAKHRLIGMRSNPSAQLFALEIAGPDGVVRREFEPAFVVNDPAGLLQAARLGMGIAQVGSNLARGPVARGDLVHLLPETAVRSRGLYAVYPSRRFVPRKVSLFISSLTAAFSERSDLT
ncbi:MAG: LysR family transcriptional regulator [Sphingosinicella sp.]|nr:LysR family transcriptional regulator [Sphingosinicella sp.]